MPERTGANQRDLGGNVRPRTRRIGKRLRDLSGAVGPYSGRNPHSGAEGRIVCRRPGSVDRPPDYLGPGQAPIEFEVAYSREDIDSRNRYSVSARIVESDGRLAFVNDTAYEVITHGNPDKVDMLLVLVEPPPGLVDDVAGSDWRTWVETPVPVVWANLMPNEREHLLRVGYLQSTIEGCARPGSQGLEVNGHDIVVRLTLMQPPPTPWGIACHEQVVELDIVEPIRESLEPGQTYPGGGERPGDHYLYPASAGPSGHVRRRVAR